MEVVEEEQQEEEEVILGLLLVKGFLSAEVDARSTKATLRRCACVKGGTDGEQEGEVWGE